VLAAPLPPAPRQPIKSQLSGERLRRKPQSALGCISARAQKIADAQCLQWRWIANSLSQVALDLVQGREVDLLEELGRDGDAACGLDLAERSVCVYIGVEVVSDAI
jgi:hypothetical protein